MLKSFESFLGKKSSVKEPKLSYMQKESLGIAIKKIKEISYYRGFMDYVSIDNVIVNW